ncbi:hypothetical protein GJAV_G00005200 [Gymnothorax javanicus]|nr:hypothetical protein GJAV_G00005200 [Gymnothorax javanicus]
MKGGHSMTGRMLGSLAKMYTDAICSGKIPCLENAVVALAQIENSNAVAEAVKFYKENMACWVAFPTETQEELSEIHGNSEKKAIDIFIGLSFKDEDQKCQLQLMELLQKEYMAICEKNNVESKKACASIIKSIFKPLEENIDSGLYMSAGGYQLYRKDLKDSIAKYRSAQGKGIKGDESLKEYLDSKQSVGQAIMRADQSLSDAQRKEEEIQVRMEAMDQERRASEEQKKVLEKQIKDQEQTFKEHVGQLEKKMEEHKKNAAKEFDTVLNSKLKEQHDLIKQGFDEKAKLMQTEIDSLRKEKDENESPGSFSNFLSNMALAASMVLPGFLPKVAGLGVHFLLNKKK